MNKLNRIKVV